MGKRRAKCIEIEDLVLITDNYMHPFSFLLGRIEDVYKSDDAVVRSALVKTSVLSLNMFRYFGFAMLSLRLVTLLLKIQCNHI